MYFFSNSPVKCRCKKNIEQISMLSSEYLILRRLCHHLILNKPFPSSSTSAPRSASIALLLRFECSSTCQYGRHSIISSHLLTLTKVVFPVPPSPTVDERQRACQRVLQYASVLKERPSPAWPLLDFFHHSLTKDELESGDVII
jgi:hypothetical protein